jgi:poly(3-hydroxybutyrate) depolymerase
MSSTRRSRLIFLIVGLAVAATACARSSPTKGRAAGAGGSDETGGQGGTGGDGGSAGGRGGGGRGGTPDSGGMAGSGGDGGMSSPDATVAVDAGQSPDSAPPGGPHPSAGCGKVNPPTGARTIMTGATKAAKFMVALPPGYDPRQPYPLGFAFHGYNLDEKSCYQGPECVGFRTVVGAKAITVFPKSIGPGWEYPVNLLAPNVQFVKDVIALMKAEYCVDESRIFVSGVSSGGQMTHHLSCQLGDQLWAAAPIAGYLEEASRTNCKGSPAQVVIHGVKDGLPKAQAARDLAATRNGCPNPPDTKALEDRIAAAFTAGRKEIGCVDYAGCARAPVRYCLHSEPLYAGNTHGWPDTGGKTIAEFLDALK